MTDDPWLISSERESGFEIQVDEVGWIEGEILFAKGAETCFE